MENTLTRLSVLMGSLLLCTATMAADAGGVVEEISGQDLKIKADFDFLPDDGQTLEVYVEIPDVGAAVVATAIVRSIENEYVLAKIKRATGTVKVGQKVRAAEESDGESSGDQGPPMKPDNAGHRERVPTTGDVESAAKTDKDRIQGLWECVSTLIDGQPSEKYVGAMAVLSADKIIWLFPNGDEARRLEGTFELDPHRVPKHIDWTPSKYPRIYQLSGDTLLLGTDMKAGSRPASFDIAKYRQTMQRRDVTDPPELYRRAQADVPTFRTALAAAESGDAEKQYAVAVMYGEGRGVSGSRQQSAAWYRKAADQGHARAQYELAVCYAEGRGVERNGPQARRWMFAAAEAGNGQAQNYAGWMYETGTGVPQDNRRARQWYESAGNSGFSPGMVNAGRYYENGVGVTASNTEAYRWFLKAGKAGDADGQHHVGRVCLEGKGVRKNEAVALQWFRAAANKGHAEAQNAVGYVYQNGFGVPQDIDEAVRWYRKAAAQGNQQAIHNLQAMGLTVENVD